MPINYTDYADNWLTEIRPRILDRARYRCELCGAKNGAPIARNPRQKVVLTVHHLNGDIGDNRDQNLKALCQACHLGAHRRARTRKSKRQLALFGEKGDDNNGK